MALAMILPAEQRARWIGKGTAQLMCATKVHSVIESDLVARALASGMLRTGQHICWGHLAPCQHIDALLHSTQQHLYTITVGLTTGGVLTTSHTVYL